MVDLGSRGNEDAVKYADVSSGDSNRADLPVLLSSGEVLRDAETVADSFGLDQAGCSAKIGSVKKSARNGDALFCGEELGMAGFVELSLLRAGNVPAALNSLGGACTSTLADLDNFD